MGVTSADIQGDILIIRGTKNEYRPRVVPMARVLAQYADAWAKYFDRMPIRTDGGLSHKARMVFDGLKATDPTFGMVTLHDATRVTFTNLALHGGADLEFIRAYIGHAPETVIAKHYGDLTPRESDMPRVQAEKLQQLRERVIAKVETKTDEVALFR